MFNFDEIENLFEYKFTYLTGILLQGKRDRMVESESQKEYLNYCIQEVKNVVNVGYRKWDEEEQDWGIFKHYIQEIEKQATQTEEPDIIAELVWKLYIILDRAFILKYEGQPLHCNPLI